jgi:hypothetical protein
MMQFSMRKSRVARSFYATAINPCFPYLLPRFTYLCSLLFTHKIKATNGVVIACDKKVSSVLVDGEEYQKIQAITPTTGERNINRYIFCDERNLPLPRVLYLSLLQENRPM